MSGRATQPKDEDRVRAADAFAYTAAFSGRASGSAAPRSRQRDNVTNSLTDDAVSDGFLSDCALSDGEDDRVGTGYGHTHAGPAQRTHAANSKAKLENFIQSQPMLTGAAVHSSADVLTMWAQQDQQHISALQRCVDEWSPRHHACPQSCDASAPELQMHASSSAHRTGNTFPVRYYSTHVRGRLAVPECQCDKCGIIFPMPATAVGCVEHTHKRPELWVDSRMCHLYHKLRIPAGLSYDLFVGGVNGVWEHDAWAATPACLMPQPQQQQEQQEQERQPEQQQPHPDPQPDQQQQQEEEEQQQQQQQQERRPAAAHNTPGGLS